MSLHLESQFTYNAWADERILTAVAPHFALPYVKEVGSHLLNAAAIWTARLEGRAAPFGTFEAHEWAELATELPRVDRWLYEYAADASDYDLRQACHYETTDGEAQSTPVVEVLTHLLYHQHYHRGQLNRAVREAGGAPVPVDYIFYQRALQAGEL